MTQWLEEQNSKHMSIGHWWNGYSVYQSKSNGACVVSSGHPAYFGPVHTSTLGEAKRVAEAHHAGGNL